MGYTGKLGSITVSAPTPIIVRFADGQVLEFQTPEDAAGFLDFYNRSPSARDQNPARIYFLRQDKWEEQS
jgi:hypothetical protein